MASPGNTTARPWLLKEAVDRLEQGHVVRAEEDLERWAAMGERSHVAGLGCVLLGKIRAEQDRWDDVVSALKDCSPPYTVEDMHAVLLGQALLEEGDAAGAIEHLQAASDRVDSPSSPLAGFLLGRALFEAGRFRLAERRLTRQLDRYPEYPGRHMVKFRIAWSLYELGKKRKAAARLDALTRSAPAGSIARGLAEGAFETVKTLKRPRRSFDKDFEHAKYLQKKRRWPEAQVLYERLLGQVRSRTVKRELHYRLARNLESLDRYNEALEHLYHARGSKGRAGDIRSGRIRNLRKLGLIDHAVELVRASAGGSQKVKGLAEAEVRYQSGEYARAYELYSKYLRTRHSRNNQWLLTWVAYRAGDTDRAISGFTALIGKRGIRKWKAEYWLARALQKAGKRVEALGIFREIADENPAGYYGIQAANRLLDLDDVESYVEITGIERDYLPHPEDREKLGARVLWNDRYSIDVPVDEPATDVRASLRAAAHAWGGQLHGLHRAWDRYRMGMHDQARKELRVARETLRRTRRVSRRLMADLVPAYWFDSKRRSRGLWGSRLNAKLGLNRWQKARRAKRFARLRRLGTRPLAAIEQLLVELQDPYWTRKSAWRGNWRTLRGVPTDANRHVFAAAYPMIFEETLREETEHYGLSPFLMTSLARVESAFNELAVSNAGARGLLQVLPVTGNLIAQRRGDTEFAPSMLLDPTTSLDYGTWYINELLAKFDGQEPLAIISYNCGPHRVDKWLARRGHNSDTDEFIEEVPYRQSRRYVKSVLKFISVYRRTWLDRPDLYVGQRLDSSFQNNINW